MIVICPTCKTELATRAPGRLTRDLQAAATNQQLITRLTETLAEIAELDGDDDNQQFKLTRFQAAQIARRAYHTAVARERGPDEGGNQ